MPVVGMPISGVYGLGSPTPSSGAAGAYLTAEEVRDICGMLEEVRDGTRSRQTYRLASAFLARFGRPTTAVLVGGDGRGD